MNIKINTHLIVHDLLKVYRGFIYLENTIVGNVYYNKNTERCVQLRDELDGDVKKKLKPIIEKWVKDSKETEKAFEQAEKKDLNEKIRNILKL